MKLETSKVVDTVLEDIIDKSGLGVEICNYDEAYVHPSGNRKCIVRTEDGKYRMTSMQLTSNKNVFWLKYKFEYSQVAEYSKDKPLG